VVVILITGITIGVLAVFSFIVMFPALFAMILVMLGVGGTLFAILGNLLQRD
jgi:hypothetical protein